MNRRGLLIFSILVSAIVLLGQLFFLQVMDNPYNVPTLSSSAVKVRYQYPERGYIYDRNGKLMVANQWSYDVMVVPREVSLQDTLEFCELLQISREDFTKKIARAKRYSVRIPSTFVRQLSKDNFAYLQEKMHKFKGFYIQKRSLREYPVKSAPNILGYISEVTEPLIQKNPYYQMGEFIGSAGVEKTYERDLRGVKGVKFIQRNRFNKEVGAYKKGRYDTIPIHGRDITLTIDSELQQYGEALMANKRGAIVAIEPATGELLTLVSAPTYDPNLMVGRERSKNFTQLYLDSINKPLFDRGLQGTYPPGSPFKIVTALSALQEGVIDPSSGIKCFEGYRYGSQKHAFMKCHCGTLGATVRLNKALYRSCNSYFADAYRKVIEKYPTPTEGMDAWSKHVRSFGFGNYLNNDLSVGQKGLIPNGNFYNRWYPGINWKATYSISNAIGQGEVLSTPIQLANMTAIVANRGFYYTPHIVKKIDGKDLDINFTKPKTTTIKKAYFEPIIEGLFNVLEHPGGTAKWSKVSGIEICGKTGTAENPHGQDHSIFIAFAPKDNPKIALAVFVENGYWGARWAGPMASLMIEKYLRGSISKPWEERRIMEGSLQDEYEKQRLEKLSKNETQKK